MSGHSYSEGVTEIYSLIARGSELNDEITILRETVSKASARLKLASEEHSVIVSSITEKMERMDVASNGNFGWQRRLA